MQNPANLLPGTKDDDWRLDPLLNPERRSAIFMQELGYTVIPTSHFDARTKRTHDIFGCGDLLCMQDGFGVLIQATTYDNHKARVNKINTLIAHDRPICEWMKIGMCWVMSWPGSKSGVKTFVPRLEAMYLPGTAREKELVPDSVRRLTLVKVSSINTNS